MLGNNLDQIVSSLTAEAPVIEMHDGEIPEFGYSDDSSRALTWLRGVNTSTSDKFDIEGVLESLNVKTHYEEMGSDNDLSGYIEKRHNGWHIGVNKYEVPGRQRFTLAHELAHLLFHRQIIQGRFEEAIKLFRSGDNTKHIEMEANAFAAELLMPSSRFRELWQSDTSLDEISNAFAVSRYAAEFRAKKLSLPRKQV
ncbi:ImmA/IrrE family metallo-endopeptidase [Emcibacter nanhaiensis]|uniref:ImmA/IrrE family metallo-endopeptidase n=1 Tax=Emcibacter nanhaiensis TaxID=1505037 RepID=A0A501PQC9_9PROT|nr:ImmA/IrrE family metallo-endopeptidase [Emcibacter nanhaiensis]TPD62730.1 ImmA/IrrE family metallo-endopeptidase [Emcibacter nanhaiensis]